MPSSKTVSFKDVWLCTPMDVDGAKAEDLFLAIDREMPQQYSLKGHDQVEKVLVGEGGSIR